jgi:tRNA 2-thiouridine synthesizing protein A
MNTVKLDTTGLRCPQPVLKMTLKMPEMEKGDILEVRGDCPTFEEDVRKWCERMKRTLLAVQKDGTAKVVQIQM